MTTLSKLISNNFLTLDGIIHLHLRLIVIIQTVDSLSLHVVFLLGLSVNCNPHFLQSLFCHLEDMVSRSKTLCGIYS